MIVIGIVVFIVTALIAACVISLFMFGLPPQGGFAEALDPRLRRIFEDEYADRP